MEGTQLPDELLDTSLIDHELIGPVGLNQLVKGHEDLMIPPPENGTFSFKSK
ncbi:MAG: hypothetical protein JW395_0362 [Nitrospira sp.]|nr:hypothetical protein [Nitrospira sp.]